MLFSPRSFHIIMSFFCEWETTPIPSGLDMCYPIFLGPSLKRKLKFKYFSTDVSISRSLSHTHSTKLSAANSFHSIKMSQNIGPQFHISGLVKKLFKLKTKAILGSVYVFNIIHVGPTRGGFGNNVTIMLMMQIWSPNCELICSHAQQPAGNRSSVRCTDPPVSVLFAPSFLFCSVQVLVFLNFPWIMPQSGNHGTVSLRSQTKTSKWNN